MYKKFRAPGEAISWNKYVYEINLNSWKPEMRDEVRNQNYDLLMDAPGVKWMMVRQET